MLKKNRINKTIKTKDRDKIIKGLVDAGVDATEVTDEVLFLLNEKLEDYAKQEKKKKKGVKDAISFLPKIDLLKEMGRGNFRIEDHYFILDYESAGWFGIEIYNINSHSSIEAEDVLSEYMHTLDSTQIELFTFIRDADFWGDDMKYGRFFRLIRDSRVKIYRDFHDRDNELKFISNPKKIEIDLFFDKDREEFIFKILKLSNARKFFSDKKNIIEITNDKISVYPSSYELNQLCSKVISSDEKYLDNKEQFAVLNENEIIDINTILENAKKFFDLKTNLPDSFLIKKHEQAKNCILVDYDSEKEGLEVSIALNYGSKVVDVSKTVYYSKIKHLEGFQFRDETRNSTEEAKTKFILNITDSEISYAKQDKLKELDLFKKIYRKKEYFGFNANGRCKVRDKKKINIFLEKYWPRIKELNYETYYVNDRLEFTDAEFKANFDVDLNAVNDWLEFDVACYCGDDRIGIDELKKFVSEKKDYVRASDGRMLRIKNRKELEKFVMMLSSFHEREDKKYTGKLYNAPELEDVFTNSNYYDAKTTEGFANFISEVKNGKPVEIIELNQETKKVLRDYQQFGINWFYFLRKYRFAGILADDMGLGKTAQALILLDREKVAGKPSIVVCPKTLIYNWQDEVYKFTPGMKSIIIDGTIRERDKMIKNLDKYDLVITSYATIRNDLAKYREKGVKFNYCVLDEAQFIKNHQTKNAQMVKMIDADYRLALTGTPLENSVAEIWSIFDFLMPGFLGTHKSFVERYQTPIMKNNSKDAMSSLRKKIEFFMLRRTKKEVLKELPDKIEQISRCQLEEDQSILYQEVLANVKSKIFKAVGEQGFARSHIHILAGLMKLRQVCNHPVLVLKDKNYKKYDSAKLTMFLQLVDEIVSAKRKVLVFSQFTSMLDILAKELVDKKIDYCYLSGKTKNRQAEVKKFKEDEKIKVFLISLKAGGTGLNLTTADNVIIFDPWWNPSVENQAIDRTHRIGQKKSVNVYRLITTGTIEEKIVELQQRKKFLFDNLVSESADMFRKLTWEDVQELFDA
jgi:SNF2 family DNA or RNA helicase